VVAIKTNAGINAMVRGRPFKKGWKGGPGGARPGSGRKPDEFRAIMRQIASRDESIRFIRDCIDGKPVDEYITKEGECIPHRSKAEVRLKALAYATAEGYGRVQTIATVDDEGQTVPLVVMLGRPCKGEKGEIKEK